MGLSYMQTNYILNQQVGIFDNGNEICFYWAGNAKGTILRGVGTNIFRLIQRQLGNLSFTKEMLFEVDSSIDEEIWETILESLLKKEIVVKEAQFESKEISNKVQDLKIGIAGQSQLVVQALQALTQMGFCKFLIETDIDNLGQLPNESEIETLKNFTESNISCCDLILFLDDTSNIRKHRQLNAIATGLTVPFLSMRLFSESFELGPLVLPGYCACFECYWQRIQGGLSDGATPQWFLEQISGTVSYSKNPQARATATIAIQYLALECMRFATSKFVPLSVGHVICQDVVKGKMRIPAILEVPGCKNCRVAGGIRRG